MGQYFKAVLAKGNTEKFAKRNIIAVFSPYDYDNGAKLMEHSYIKNELVGVVTDEIRKQGGCRLRWTGDYAENNVDVRGVEDQSELGNLYSLTDDMEKKGAKWSKKVPRYIINESNKEFVDVKKCRKDKYGYTIHPMPLLCCDSNGQGGGDYYADNGQQYVGSWTGDIISVSDEAPEGYTEIVPDFFEGDE